MPPRPLLSGVCTLTLLSFFICSPVAAKGPVTAKHGMVVAQEPLAADVGLQVLKNGGNAIDAAVAVGFALAVTHPSAGNIGGGGFLLVRLANGEVHFVDFREAAPQGATRDMYLGPDGNPTQASLVGWRASGVPGSVKGFETASKKWGSKKWADLLAPALHLARDGFRVDKTLAAELRGSANTLSRDPESRRIFLRGGRPYQEGEIFRQPELASSLQRIAAQGGRDFYQGETARKLAAAMEAHGGLISRADLAGYRAIPRTPLEGDYHGYHIITAPPPSAGGVGILQMFGMLSRSGYESDGPDSPKAVHYMAETMRRYYADRSEYLGDPDFYRVPVRQLLSPSYIAARIQSIQRGRATPSADVPPGPLNAQAAGLSQHESTETTHFNIVDAQGNAVAVTYTLNGGFGSGVTVPGLGFLLNNEMDDFVAKPGSPNMFGLVGGKANSIEPGKRPLSSMTPTILTRNGKLFMAVGAPGGSRITTGVFQVIADVIDFHMNPQDAVNIPRFHHQWKPDILYLQKGFSPGTEQALAKMGYTIQATGGVARVEAIVVNNGVLEGGTESRQNGKVAGY
jgi:gamma-glutamyltranspeptidase / glutathione hydrolase